jgi:hypothetical protein
MHFYITFLYLILSLNLSIFSLLKIIKKKGKNLSLFEKNLVQEFSKFLASLIYYLLAVGMN